MTTVCQNTPDAASKDIQSLSDGFYYKTRKSWQKLEPLAMAGGGLKHMGKMFVPGLTPQMVWTFRDAESPVRITDKRPTFYIRELPQLADIAGRTYIALLIYRYFQPRFGVFGCPTNPATRRSAAGVNTGLGGLHGVWPPGATAQLMLGIGPDSWESKSRTQCQPVARKSQH